MTDILTDAYWQNEFDITDDDLERIADRIRRENRAFTLSELAQRVVRGRLKHGEDTSPAAMPEWVVKEKVRSWDEVETWQVGERVLVARSEQGQTKPYFGVITHADQDTFYIDLEEVEGEIKYGRVVPGSPAAHQRYEHIKKLIREKEMAVRQQQRMAEDEENIELVLLGHGTHIATRLLSALENDERYVICEDRWFLTDLLVDMTPTQLTALHKRMLAHGESQPMAEVLSLVSSSLTRGDVGLFSLYKALENDRQDRFEKHGTQASSQWRALKPPPPPWEQAVGMHYVYDPDTYEIILQPGQPLKKKVAERLENLGWYEEVVAAA